MLAADNDSAKRSAEAAAVLQEVMATPDKEHSAGTARKKPDCIVIVPDLKTGAFVFGAKYGKGFSPADAEERHRLGRRRHRSASKAGA